MKTLLRIAALIAGFIVSGFCQKEIPMPTEKGNIVLIYDKISPHTVGQGQMAITVSHQLEGSIRNDTPFKLRSLIFEGVGFDESGADIKLCDEYNNGSRCEFRLLRSVGSGETVKIDYFGTFHPTAKGIKRLTRFEFRVIDSPYYIQYTVESAPVVNNNFTVNSTFDIHGIRLDFKNNSSDVIEILWDQSMYIDEAGTSSRLIRANVRIVEKDRPQPNTVVPPGSKVQETVFPIDHVRRSSDGFYQSPLFPELGNAASKQSPVLDTLAGKTVKLFLRLLVNEQKQNVTIPFKISRVEY